MQTVHRARLAGIDGLRAIAILSVVIYHLRGSLLPGGFTGVDVFFVISGYVISKSLAAQEWANFGDLILSFYRRRILRIFPALVVFLIVVSLLSILFIPDAWLSKPNKRTALTAFFGVSNFYLVNTADGYFSQQIPFNPFVHTWSLAVEEQFYLFFPLIFYGWLQAHKKEGVFHHLATWSLPAIGLASLGFAAYQSKVAPDQAFYLLPSRWWELAAGALLLQWQIRSQPRRFPITLNSESKLQCGALVLLFGFVFANEAQFPFPWAIVPMAGTLLMISGVTDANVRGGAVRAWVESTPMVYVGLISYSLYLWHWPVFSLLRWTIGMESLWIQASALVLAFALASVSYHFVENAFRFARKIQKSSNQLVIAVGLTGVCAATLTIALLFRFDAALGLKLSVTTNSRDWSASYNNADEGGNVAGRPKPKRQIFVIGDSHAGAYETMVKTVASQLDAQAFVVTRLGCSFARLNRVAVDDPRCQDFVNQTVEWVAQKAKPGDIVFLAELRIPRLANQLGLIEEVDLKSPGKLQSESAVRDRALAQAVALVQKFQKIGLHVMMDAPKPVFKSPAFRCADWFNRSNPVCKAGFLMNRAALLNLRAPTMASLDVLAGIHGVYVWDPFPILCNSDVCAAFDGEKPVFSDGDHLSGHGNRLLIPSFKNQLLAIWAPKA